MKLLRGFRHLPELMRGCVATIGNFDGVHRGHQTLLHNVAREAHRLALPSLVILFEPQPSEFFLHQTAPARLTCLREKLQALKNYKIDYVYCLRFNAYLANMPAEEFAQTIIFSLLQVKFLFVGHDFRFGRNRQGNLALLENLSYKWAAEVASLADFRLHGQRVSSTLIRQHLAAGKLNEAANFLGRLYSICGRVIHGKALGRAWGYPTININLGRNVVALQGIFCVKVQLPQRLVYGVASLGYRPTVDGKHLVLEVHLFEFDEIIYGIRVQVFFLHKLRDEVKFDTIEELVKQIECDAAMARAYFQLSKTE